MAAHRLIDQFITHPAFADASRSPLQFFVVGLQKRQAAEQQLAHTGTLHIPDYTTVNQPLLGQKIQAVHVLQQMVARYTTDEDTAFINEWLARRETEITLIKALAILHRPGYTAAQLAEVNRLCDQLYGAYSSDLFYHHLQLLLAKAASNQTNAAWDYITTHLPLAAIAGAAKTIAEPTEADFMYYKRLARQQFKLVETTFARHATKGQQVFGSAHIQAMVSELLHAIGATTQGWRAVQSGETTKIGVNYAKKTIYIKEGSFRMTSYRLCGLLAHEVMVHVGRKLHATPVQQLAAQAQAQGQAFEEGLGVLAEQIFLPRFRHLRQFRYVAIGLARGTDGTPRTFAEVYELLWRLKYLTQQAGTEETARHYAFDETSRIFRGLPPTLRGVAFTKDKLYVEGNADVWRRLTPTLTPAEFADFLLKR